MMMNFVVYVRNPRQKPLNKLSKIANNNEETKGAAELQKLCTWFLEDTSAVLFQGNSFKVVSKTFRMIKLRFLNNN